MALGEAPTPLNRTKPSSIKTPPPRPTLKPSQAVNGEDKPKRTYTRRKKSKGNLTVAIDEAIGRLKSMRKFARQVERLV